MPKKRKLCTFFLDETLFGIEVEKVQEVVRHLEMTRVPLAPPVVGGLINLRGQIVTTIDLRMRLGLGPRSAERLATNIVLEEEGGSVSLCIDEISGVLEVPEDAFEDPPESLGESWRELIRGVYKLPERLLLVLNVERVADITADFTGSAPMGRKSP